ncbi:TPA: SDR family NAD(P)-dependent oxidoreductase, partial [Staphylococcus aureus]
MTNWLGLNKKVVIVTGGSSGIGHAIVKELLEQGAVVYNADLNNNNINNENYHYFNVDVTNKSSVKQVVDNIFNTEKKIDVLVNNAGINLPRTLIDS